MIRRLLVLAAAGWRAVPVVHDVPRARLGLRRLCGPADARPVLPALYLLPAGRPMTPDADPRPLAATQGDETAVSASTSVRGGSGAQNGAEGRELHKLRTEHVGVGWARCWIVACPCGWKARGSTKTRREAIDWLMPQNCPESIR